MERILVCDDQKEIVNAVKIYLEQAGYTLYTAFNGKRSIIPRIVKCVSL